MSKERELLKKLLDKDSWSLSADEAVLLSEWLLLSVKVLGALVNEQFPSAVELEPDCKGYINIYKSEGGFRGGHVWATRKEADDNREKDWVYCARIESDE